LLVIIGSKIKNKKPGVDFAKTYSPVFKPTTIRLALFLAISPCWPIRQIDIQNAFLHGWLSEDVYMTQSPRFIDPQFPHYICKLHKALYGLKQAPRAWYSRLSDHLLKLGFVNSRFDPSLFIRHTPQKTTNVLIYVDDILLTSSLPQGTTSLLHSLHTEFVIKDLGPLHFFFGMEATTTPAELILSQQHYILDFLHKSNMTDAKPVKTLMSTTHTLSLLSGDPLTDPTSYRSIVGALQYMPSPFLISHLLSTKSLNSCIDSLPSIYKLSNVFYGTSSLQSLMAYSFVAPHLPFSEPSQMPIAPAVPTTENLLLVSVFFSAPISFHGLPQKMDSRPLQY
jgi:hypothetical protein